MKALIAAAILALAFAVVGPGAARAGSVDHFEGQSADAGF